MKIHNKKGSDRLLIMLHGFKADYRGNNIFTYLSEHIEADSYLYDAYSCGEREDRLENYNLFALQDELDQIIESFDLNYKKIYLLGHSLGGRLAVNAKSEKINGLILINPALGKYYEEPHFFSEQYERIIKEINESGHAFFEKEQERILISRSFMDSLAFYRKQENYPKILCFCGSFDKRILAQVVKVELDNMENEYCYHLLPGDHTLGAKVEDYGLLKEVAQMIERWIE